MKEFLDSRIFVEKEEVPVRTDLTEVEVKKRSVHEELEQQWAESERHEFIKSIKAGKDINEIMKSWPGFKEAYLKKLNIIACADERVSLEEGGKIGIAGQLMLLTEQEVDEFVKANKGKIDAVSSHFDCGAAKIIFDRLKDKEHGFVIEKIKIIKDGVEKEDEIIFLTADQYSEFKSRQLAEKLDAKYLPITGTQMSGEIHNARMIFLDGTGKFSPADMENLPSHFVCSGPGFGLSNKNQIIELSALAEIALAGEHSYSNKFTASSPFYIIISAKDEQQLAELMKTAKGSVENYGDRVEVKGFIKNIEEDVAEEEEREAA